jgi:hypothetical protein
LVAVQVEHFSPAVHLLHSLPAGQVVHFSALVAFVHASPEHLPQQDSASPLLVILVEGQPSHAALVAVQVEQPSAEVVLAEVVLVHASPEHLPAAHADTSPWLVNLVDGQPSLQPCSLALVSLLQQPLATSAMLHVSVLSPVVDALQLPHPPSAFESLARSPAGR